MYVVHMRVTDCSLEPFVSIFSMDPDSDWVRLKGRRAASTNTIKNITIHRQLSNESSHEREA